MVTLDGTQKFSTGPSASLSQYITIGMITGTILVILNLIIFKLTNKKTIRITSVIISILLWIFSTLIISDLLKIA